MSDLKKEYKKKVKSALDNEFLRKSMDNFAVAYRDGQTRAYNGIDKEALVKEIVCLKDAAAANLEELYVQFKKKAEEKGIKVYLADTAEDANRIIADIARTSGNKTIVKSKSMTSEETHLNRYLEAENLKVTETDLGEWIIQLRKEGPSHMVMPAIHLSRYQVSDLFSDVTRTNQDPENIDNLVKVARAQLRSKFSEADMGITGANFLLADTATAGIVTNEGNARLTSTLPKTHVVLAGVDKLLPGLPEALTVLKALPRNATGQAITSYVTWITGQNECVKNEDNKKDIHIVLLDNGRRALSKDKMFNEVLRCIRCGACANVCPVYRMVGGHTMGHVYIGAIGLILTYFYHGKEAAEKLIGNCIGCGACKNICAGGMNLPDVIKSVAAEIQGENGRGVGGKLATTVLKNRKFFHTLLKFAKFSQKPLTDNSGFLRHLPMIFAKDHDFKSLPQIADKSFRDIWKDIQPNVTNPEMRVAIFAGCVQDFVYPEQLKSFVNLLKNRNIAVDFPMDQSCCGLPLKMMDEHASTRSVARQNILAFDAGNYDYIITLCASCASHLNENYEKMFNPSEGAIYRKSQNFSGKVITSGKFLKDVVKLDVNSNASKGKKVTFHSPCHLTHCMKAGEATKDLITSTGAEFIPASEEKSCCGFGGTYSAKFPEISAEILNKKLANFKETGADVIVTECPGCIMQLRGGIDKNKMDLEVKHFVELLDD